MSQFQENLWTDRWMDKRTDEQTLFYSTLPAEAGGPIIPTFFLNQSWKLKNFMMSGKAGIFSKKMVYAKVPFYDEDYVNQASEL